MKHLKVHLTLRDCKCLHDNGFAHDRDRGATYCDCLLSGLHAGSGTRGILSRMSERALAIIILLCLVGALVVLGVRRYRRHGLSLGPPPEGEDEIGM